MDAQTQAWIDQENARRTATIRCHGWDIQYVIGSLCSHTDCECADNDGPAFGYTIGLFGMGHPELLIFGLDPTTVAGVFNNLGERVPAGESLLPGQVITFAEWPHRIIPEEVPNPSEIVFGANDFYKRPVEFSVPVLQLSYDDLAGEFLWDDGYAAPHLQPRPGTFRA